jgi:biopolymer transport protein ExbB/TolQ
MMNYLSLLVDGLLWAFMAVVAFVVLKKVRELYFSKATLMLEKQGAPTEVLDARIEALEAGLTILAVLSSTAAFVGLAGTVIHIIEALSKLTGSGLDIGIISGPIAVALYATLKGLLSAIPAAAAYSLFQRRIQLIEARAARAYAATKASEVSA